MEKIGVVVLNFEKYEETIACVNSLLNQKNICLKIVVVDNGSGNRSWDLLNDNYKNNNTICLVKSDDNLGFANGMNLGIDLLRDKYKIDNIFIANSDLIFLDDNCLVDMLEAYEEGVGVISPYIINLDGSRDVYISFKKKFLRLRMIKTFIEGWIKNSKSKNKVKPVKKDIKNIASDHIHDKRGKKEILNDRYEIAGSGYMYTRDYFNKYNRMYPKTFLYEEEYATILYLDKAGLKTAWADTKPITHKHGASTPEDFKNKSSKSKLKRTNKWVIIKLMFMSYKMIQNIYN